MTLNAEEKAVDTVEEATAEDRLFYKHMRTKSDLRFLQVKIREESIISH